MNVPLLGISPLNPNEVLARLPEEAQNDEEAKEAIDKSVLKETGTSGPNCF